MDEDEWLACANPLRMLQHLQARPDARQTTLLTCACVRRIWQVLPAAGRAWVEMAERASAGFAYDTSLDEGCEYAIQAAGQQSGLGEAGVIHAVQQIFHAFWEAPELVEFEEPDRERVAESRVQADLVRCIFGNPCRPVSSDRALLTWRERTIPALAQAAYQERDLPGGLLQADKLAILADALEEAGCTNDDMLRHLRGRGPHVRGCWVVDLFLERK